MQICTGRRPSYRRATKEAFAAPHHVLGTTESLGTCERCYENAMKEGVENEGRRGARTPNSSLVRCKNKCSLFIFFGRNPVDVPSDTKLKTGMRLRCRSWRGRTARQLRNAVTTAHRDKHNCGTWSIAGQSVTKFYGA